MTEEATRLVAIYRTRQSIKFDRRTTEFDRQSQKAEGTRRSKRIQLADDVRTSNMKIEKGGINFQTKDSRLNASITVNVSTDR